MLLSAGEAACLGLNLFSQPIVMLLYLSETSSLSSFRAVDFIKQNEVKSRSRAWVCLRHWGWRQEIWGGGA